jgi:hypothetical protein
VHPREVKAALQRKPGATREEIEGAAGLQHGVIVAGDVQRGPRRIHVDHVLLGERGEQPCGMRAALTAHRRVLEHALLGDL